MFIAVHFRLHTFKMFAVRFDDFFSVCVRAGEFSVCVREGGGGDSGEKNI